MSEKLPCAVEAWEAPGYWQAHECQKGARHQVLGLWLCRTHYNQLQRNRWLVLPGRVLRLDDSSSA